MSAEKSKAVPTGYKVWIVVSLGILLASAVLFVMTVTAGFVYFTDKTSPVWVTALGVAALAGMGLSLGGMALIFLMIATKARRSDKNLAAEQG